VISSGRRREDARSAGGFRCAAECPMIDGFGDPVWPATLAKLPCSVPGTCVLASAGAIQQKETHCPSGWGIQAKDLVACGGDLRQLCRDLSVRHSSPIRSGGRSHGVSECSRIGFCVRYPCVSPVAACNQFRLHTSVSRREAGIASASSRFVLPVSAPNRALQAPPRGLVCTSVSSFASSECYVPRCAVRTWISTHGHGRMRWPRAHR
jgi:hypothetical protein